MFTGRRDEPVVLEKFSPVLHIVQQIRDEAHRFAVTFHRSRRNTARLTSELEQIRGVGDRTVKKLLQSFRQSGARAAGFARQSLRRWSGLSAARKVRAHLELLSVGLEQADTGDAGRTAAEALLRVLPT